MSAEKKKVRERFRESVFLRDGNRCRVCGAQGVPLDAHHISPRDIMPEGGYVPENGITLCNVPGGCHEKAEEFFASNGLTVLPGFSPEELYRLIKSKYEKAFEASKRLSRR